MLKKKFTYFIALAVIAVFISFFTVYSGPASTITDTSFKAEFVGNPLIEEKELSISGHTLPYTEYKSGDYSVSFATLPSSLTRWGYKLILEGALKILTQDAHLLEKHSSTCDVFPSLDYEIESQDGPIVGKLVLTHQKLYKIEALYHQPSEKEEAVKFLESFHPEEVK